MIQLIDKGACEEERDLFFKCFGEELELPTDLQAQEKLAAELTKWHFSMFWAGRNLMEWEKYSEWRLFEELSNHSYLRIPFSDYRRESAHLYYRTECWLKMIKLMVSE